CWWDLTPERVTKPLFEIRAHDGPVWKAVFLPGGKQVLSGGDDGKVRRWDVDQRTGIAFTPENEPTRVWDVAISADGSTALSGGEDGMIRLWNVKQGKRLTIFPKVGGKVFTVALSADGKRACTAGEADNFAVRYWDVEQ